MSHADPGPLAAYNSLQDKHLAGYFSNSRMKRHLRKSGLVTRKGKIIDEKTYRLNMAKKEHRKHVRDLLATAIVHKTLDMERIRQHEIRKRLDETYKVELVRRVKEGRKRKGDEDILPLLSPRDRTARQIHNEKHRERPATAPATFVDHGEEEETPLKPSEIYYDNETQKIYYRVDSSPPQMNGYHQDETEELGPSPYTRAYPATYPAPAPPPSGTPRRTRTAGTPRKGVRLQRFHYLARTEPAVARRVQLQSMAEVTMKFLGPSLVLTNSMFPEDRLSEVMVLQQHCGGSTLCVFRELLPPNTIFTFISRRHRGAPFGLTFYIDGMQDIRLSSCCEYKHKPGHVLGGKNGHFQFIVVEGAAPCYRCQIVSAHRPSKNKHKYTQGSGDGEDADDRSKTFMTETANELEEEEQGETFDVIITKIKSGSGEDGDEEKDAGGMVDHSTQTPRDEGSNKDEKLNTDDEKTAGSAVSVLQESKQDEDGAKPEDSGADKYDNEEFEEGPEKDKDNQSESEAKEETDKEDDETKDDERDEDYNEDFESDEEKERDKSDDEDGDDTESEKEDEEDPEDDIQDETEDKEKTEAGKEEQAEEVDDETDKEKQDNTERPTSATDSEGRQSKNVSFDEDVTVIEDEQEEEDEDEEERPEDVPEEVAVQNDQEDPVAAEQEDIREETDDIPEEVLLESPRRKQQDEEASRNDVKENKQDEEQLQDDAIRSPEPSDSSSSSSSSESSDGSDSEDGGKKDPKSKKKEKGKAKSRPGQDPGSDPDLVSSGQLPDQALKAIGVQPGTKHEGSIQSLLEGKEEVELAGIALTKEQFEEVARIIDSREDLGSVILRNTSADDSVLEILTAPLINSPTLKMLNLSANRIGPEGAKHLAHVIRENKSLKMLLLHGNPLTDEGVGIIIDAITETKDTLIMNLDLGDCGLTQDGAKHIAKLIEHNTTVTILTISGNNIQLEGWQTISKALTNNSSVEILSLDFSKIGDEEAITIAEGIQGCKSLRSVDLEGNKIGDEGGRKLFEAVKANKSIVDLTLVPMNQISKEIVDGVKDFLKEREKGNDGSEEQHETEDSAFQPQQKSVEQGVVNEASSTETSHMDTASENPPTQKSSEERQEQQENEGATEVKQDEQPLAELGAVQDEQGKEEEEDKEADDREQPSGEDQQKEEDPAAVEKEEEVQQREHSASEKGVGHLPDGDHLEYQQVAPAKDDQDGNEPQQRDSEGEQGSPRSEQPQISKEPEESSRQEASEQDPSEQEGEKEDNAPRDPAFPVNLGANNEEESNRVSLTEGEGYDNKQEGLDKENEDEQVEVADSVAGASSPVEDAQQNSSHTT